MLKLRDLATRADFEVGPLNVSPSTRRIRGPAGQVQLEPLIMQVFLLLLDSAGRVVTRDELFDQCWGGVVVGDDSLNRAIARIRRISDVAPGLFEVETIPRTGYRLTGDILDGLARPGPGQGDKTGAAALSRRTVVRGGILALAIAGGAALWSVGRKSDPRFDSLLDRGREALRLDEPAAKYFQQAIALEPRNPTARGLLAYALLTDSGDGASEITGPGALIAERAARAALNLDDHEPNALLTMTLLQSDMLDWFSREQRYRRILAIDPDNTLAMRSLGQLLHGVGRCRESLAMTERAIAIDPLVPDHQVRKALRLWVLGRTADADGVINRAMLLWPSHRLVRLGRLMIYAFTGRADAALAMIDDERTAPVLLTPAAAAVWRASLRALDSPTGANVALARKATLDGARTTAAVAAWGILVLSQLGDLDAAFEVADGFLLGRGSIVVKVRPDANTPSVHGPGWRNTYGLFTPPTRAMRLDPRFTPLSSGLGLTEYWRKRGIGPDRFLFAH